MRRRLGRFLPIVMLAMLVQIFAPISASWAFGVAASDPLHLAGICSDASNSATTDRGSTDQQPAHNNCCTLCCMAQSATSTGDPQASIIKLERNANVVVWRELTVALPTAGTGSNAQARGPPGIS